MVSDADLALLDLPTWQLDVMLGEALTAEEFGAKDLSDTEKQAASRRWLTANLDRLRGAVCGSRLKGELFSHDAADRTLLFASVIDALGTIAVGLPVPATVLSARLIQYGLDQLCGTESKD